MSSIPSTDLSDIERSDLNSASTPTSPGGLHESFQSLDSDSTNTNTTDDASVKTVEIDGEIYTNARYLSRKRARQSWVFQHGIELRSKASKPKWWCQICRKEKNIDLLLMTSGISHIKAHLSRVHKVTNNASDLRHNMALAALNSLSLSESLSLSPLVEQVAQFRKSLIEWITLEHISYRQIQAKSFQVFIKLCSLTAESFLPKSGNTVRGWIIDEFIRQQTLLQDQVLPLSKSLIHLTFDGWTA